MKKKTPLRGMEGSLLFSIWGDETDVSTTQSLHLFESFDSHSICSFIHGQSRSTSINLWARSRRFSGIPVMMESQGMSRRSV